MKSLLIALSLLALAAGAAFAQDVCAPAKVTDLHQDLLGYHSYTIEWTNTGDDCSTGNATTYELRRATVAITDTNWQTVSTVVASDVADANGNETCFAVTESCPATTHYYAVFLIDEAGNRSPISNGCTGKAKCGTPYIEVECY